MRDHVVLRLLCAHAHDVGGVCAVYSVSFRDGAEVPPPAVEAVHEDSGFPSPTPVGRGMDGGRP